VPFSRWGYRSAERTSSLQTSPDADLVHHPGEPGRFHRAKAEVDFVVALNPRPPAKISIPCAAAELCSQRLRSGSRTGGATSASTRSFSKLAAEAVTEVKLRKLIANMVYVGVMAEILSIDVAEVEGAIRKQFRSKSKRRRSTSGP